MPQKHTGDYKMIPTAPFTVSEMCCLGAFDKPSLSYTRLCLSARRTRTDVYVCIMMSILKIGPSCVHDE
jgi:hypothetical protein